MTPRLLRVRCARWDQVDAFLHKKLRPDGRLSMKVPFVAEPGAPVTVAIELPNQIVVALDGVVGAPAQRDRPDAAVVVLAGAKAAIDRLSAMVADARVGGGDGDLSATLAAREAELRRLRQQARDLKRALDGIAARKAAAAASARQAASTSAVAAS